MILTDSCHVTGAIFRFRDGDAVRIGFTQRFRDSVMESFSFIHRHENAAALCAGRVE
jgi:hypothetical protein